MAFQALAIAPALGKLGALLGLGGKAAAAKQLVIPGLAAATKAGGTKMAAGGAFKSALGNALKAGFAPDPTKAVTSQVLGRVAPDIFFGGLAAAQTPGDIGDKAIAGLTQAAGGALGGGLTTGLTRGKLGMLGELAGGYGGDMLGIAVGDNLQRGKDVLMGGKGQTAFERMGEEQQQRFANQIRNETLMSMGIGPGYLPGVQDQYLAELGLG